MRYAIIEIATKKVANVIEWDGKTSWVAPEGHYTIQDNLCQIGDTYPPATKPSTPQEIKM